MKRLLSLLALILLSVTCKAQMQLDDFYKDGSSWCEHEGHGLGHGIYIDFDYLFFIDGDTAINNQLYHKLKQDNRSSTIGGIRVSGDTVFFLRTQAYASTTWPDINGFIASHPLGSEDILYRFDLQVGDTIKWKHSYGNVVTSIDKIELSNGDSVNQYHFDIYDRWIYGIGGPGSLFSPTEIHGPGNGHNVLYYYFNPSFTYNAFPADVSHCFPTDVSNIKTKQKHFSIYPNPLTDNTLHITSPGIEKLSIVDITGKIVYATSQLPSGEQAINIDVPAGVYILKAQLIGGTTEMRKIVRQ